MQYPLKRFYALAAVRAMQQVDQISSSKARTGTCLLLVDSVDQAKKSTKTIHTDLRDCRTLLAGRGLCLPAAKTCHASDGGNRTVECADPSPSHQEVDATIDLPLVGPAPICLAILRVAAARCSAVGWEDELVLIRATPWAVTLTISILPASRPGVGEGSLPPATGPVSVVMKRWRRPVHFFLITCRSGLLYILVLLLLIRGSTLDDDHRRHIVVASVRHIQTDALHRCSGPGGSTHSVRRTSPIEYLPRRVCLDSDRGRRSGQDLLEKN